MNYNSIKFNLATLLNSVPESEWEVLEPHALAEVEHDRLEDEDGPGRAEDGERLPGEEAVGDAHDQARDEGLDGGDPGVMLTCHIVHLCNIR